MQFRARGSSRAVSLPVDTVDAMTSPAIEAIELVKKFGGTASERPAVEGVSFVVPPRTVLGLLGPNGAGKTTTVRMMTTLTVPDQRDRHVAGYDVLANLTWCVATWASPARSPPWTNC